MHRQHDVGHASAPIGVHDEQVLGVVELAVSGSLERLVNLSRQQTGIEPRVADEQVASVARGVNHNRLLDEPASQLPVKPVTSSWQVHGECRTVLTMTDRNRCCRAKHELIQRRRGRTHSE